MGEIEVPVSADSDDPAPVTDGGEDSPTALGAIRSRAKENYTDIGLLDKLPGRVIFAAGAISGSFLTILLMFIVVRFT